MTSAHARGFNCFRLLLSPVKCFGDGYRKTIGQMTMNSTNNYNGGTNKDSNTIIMLASTNTTTTIQPTVIDNNISSPELRIMFMIFLLAIGLFLNLTLILLFLTRHQLATSCHLLANLAVSNCIACFFHLPYMLVTLFTSDRIMIGGVKWPCEWSEAVSDSWWISQNLTILLISYERYKYIANPFHQNTTPKKVFYTIAAIWCTTFVVLSLIFTPWIGVVYRPQYKTCRKQWELSLSYSIFYTIVTFWLPTIALFYSHMYMLRECYLKKKLISVVSGRIIQHDRTINPDQYVAAIDRSLSLDMLRNKMTKETLPNNRNNGVNYMRTFMPVRDVSSAWSGTSSRTNSLHDINTMRKRSLQTKSMRKSVQTTVLIFACYLLATLPQLLQICFYMTGKEINVNLEAAIITRYTLIISFPYIFGPHTTVIKKEISLMYHRLRCWKSGKIRPSLNIDEKDYTDNVVRRDSRRESLAASRKNSMSKPIEDIYPVFNFNRIKDGIENQHPETTNDIITPIFFIRNEMFDRAATLTPVQ